MQTESQIVQLILQRDQRGLSHLYHQYASSIMGIIHRIIPDRSIAEEVLQQTLLKIWDKIELYDESKSGLFTWMSIIARNTALDKTRLKGYQRSQNAADISSDDVANAHVVDETTSASIDAHQLLSKLESKHRVLMEKMYLEGCSQSDIAQQLDIPLGTVKTRLRAAISILREELKDEKGLFLASIGIILYLIMKLSA